MTTASTLRCKCRRQAPTSLRCARCSVPICPECSRVAPAGMLCNDCATGRRTHVYEVGVGHVARGAVATLAVALFGGWLFATMSNVQFFLLWLGFLYGLVVAETNLRVTGRKRGTAMEVVVGVSCCVGLIGGFLLHGTLRMPDLAEYLRYTFTDPWVYAAIGCALFGGISRIRNF